MIKNKLLNDSDTQLKPKRDILTYVNEFQERLYQSQEYACKNFIASQVKMKSIFDAKAIEFALGDKVLVLLPISGSALTA